MTADAAGLGWVVAGGLLVASGVGLAMRAHARASGTLFAVAGVLLVLVGFAPADVATSVGVAAMATLTAATSTYPRLTWDLARVLTLAGVLLGTPLLAWRLGAAAHLSEADTVWLAVALAGVGGSHLWWRLETSDAETRSAMLWVLSTGGVTAFLVGIVTLSESPTGIAMVVHASVGLIGVAALLGADPRDPPDGRWWASRAAAWFFSVACAFAVATLILTLIEWGSGAAPGIVPLALAAVACGTLWSPLLDVVQRVSDGLLFGFRPDALTAAERVAVGVGDDPAAAIRAIQEGLVLPYAALALADEDLVEVGTPTAHQRVFPVDFDGEHIGDLTVGIRPGDLGLSRDDERVLTLALPILVQTIRARSVAANLQRARMASASAREEERRRLRRDLHDGLGPRLTGIAFTADAARLSASTEAAGPMLDRIRREAELALDEIRELAYGLRPPALDELGLVGAIRLKADGFDVLETHVETSLLPSLPAAVEVAAYRIVIEALTNVARHSGATRATVTLRHDASGLTISVTDDGDAGGAWVPGIGLTSMRERAEELGGSVTYRPASSGSAVTALLPLAPPPGAVVPDDDHAQSH